MSELPPFTPNWDLSRVVDHLHDALFSREKDLLLEQAVYGIDSLDELQLHELLAAHLSKHMCVSRESYYPSSAGNKRTHRMRCDLALTPLGRPLTLDYEPAGLFDPVNPAGPADALWVEVKVARQFRAPGERHAGYGQQWRTSVVNDIKKIEGEPMIHEAALLLIVFTEADWVIEKDLDLLEDVLVQKEVLAGSRQVRHVKISDRIGHTRASVALWPTVARHIDRGA